MRAAVPEGAPTGSPATSLGSARERAEHFDAMHRSDTDPWDVRTSWYERRKYAITIAALPREHYRRVWEPGCSVGGLTVLLAGRADEVDASDLSPAAITEAQAATAGLAGVLVAQAVLPDPAPRRDYDLVVLSEVLYYLPDDEREQALRRAEEAAAPDADLVVVHWRHHPEDAWASGAAVNAAVRVRPGWTLLAQHDEPDFVLDVLTRHRP